MKLNACLAGALNSLAFFLLIKPFSNKIAVFTAGEYNHFTCKLA
jgi:hypothetical protein